QPGDAGYIETEDRQRSAYQELRLESADPKARLAWTTGLYFSHRDENVPDAIFDGTLQQEVLTYTTAQGVPYDLCAAPLSCPTNQTYAAPEYRSVDQQIALFGEVSYKVTDTLKVTGGLRVERARVSGKVNSGGPFAGGPLIYDSAVTNETPITPKYGLSWEPV